MVQQIEGALAPRPRDVSDTKDRWHNLAKKLPGYLQGLCRFPEKALGIYTGKKTVREAKWPHGRSSLLSLRSPETTGAEKYKVLAAFLSIAA